MVLHSRGLRAGSDNDKRIELALARVIWHLTADSDLEKEGFTRARQAATLLAGVPEPTKAEYCGIGILMLYGSGTLLGHHQFI